MRPDFRISLETYGRIAKDMSKAQSSEEAQTLAIMLDWHINQEMATATTGREIQEQIFALQQKKLEIMSWLKTELGRLDHPEMQAEQPSDTILIKSKQGKFFYERQTPGGKTRHQTVTLGELLTDGDWGVRYYLDPNSVSRLVRKQFLVKEAKRRLQNYLDEQIVLGEVASERTHPVHKSIYTSMQEQRESKQESNGHLFERMVRNFLTKFVYDYDLPFEVVQSDIQMDVEQKIDFILRRQGVEPKAIGVQLTRDSRHGSRIKKHVMLRRARSRLDGEVGVTDIVPVTLPTSIGRGQVEQWEKQGRLPGGPERTWSKDFKRKIFFSVLKKFATQIEIESWWAKASQ